MSGGLLDSRPLNRAQRRFLGLVLPFGLTLVKEDFIPIESVFVSNIALKMLVQRHQGAGQLQGGALLGEQREATLHIDAVLPSSCTPQHPYDMQPEYLLGALDVVTQFSLNTDWVGNWIMPGDGLPPTPAWTEEMWQLARRHALVSDSHVLLTVGMAQDRLEIDAWSEQDGQPLRLPVRKSEL